MNQQQQAIGLLTAGLAGLALGLAAGILLAPQSGRETRAAVRRNVERAVDTGRSYVDRVRNRGGDEVVEEVND
jgi:gas vesicle protein